MPSRNCPENPTLLQTKMGKVCTGFQIKKAQKWFPTLWGGGGAHTYMAYIREYPPGVRTPSHDQGQKPMTMKRLWLQSRQFDMR